jgi:hypothetical protein
MLALKMGYIVVCLIAPSSSDVNENYFDGMARGILKIFSKSKL